MQFPEGLENTPFNVGVLKMTLTTILPNSFFFFENLVIQKRIFFKNGLIFIAPWCTEMHRDAPRWLYFFYNIFWILLSATELIYIALLSSYLHRDASRCTVMHRDAPWYTGMALFLL